MKLERKIPTALGVILLVISLAAGVFLVNQRQIFRLGAAPGEEPKNVRITNITDTGFTLSWITDKATVGFVSYGEGNTNSTAREDQDKEVQKTVHHVTLSNLKEGKTYSFKIGSGKQTFDQNGKPWTQKTAPKLPARTAELVSGSVKNEAALPAKGTVVYITLQTASPLSAVTDAGGQYSLSLASLRSTDLSSFAKYDGASVLSLFVQGENGKVSSAQVTVSNAKPVPAVTLGQTHDFRKQSALGGGGAPAATLDLPQTSPSASPETGSGGFSLEPLSNPVATSGGKLTVEYPKEGETISSGKPEFRGTGLSGATLNITLISPALTDKLTIPSDGIWKWTPTKTISGKSTITVSGRDAQGKTQSVTRNFTVGTAIGAPSFTASGSATPSASPSAKPTATPKATGSARVSLPSTEGGVPVSGDLTFTFSLFILGIVSTFGGVLLFRKV